MGWAFAERHRRNDIIEIDNNEKTWKLCPTRMQGNGMMKSWMIGTAALVLLASCSERQLVEDVAAKAKVTVAASPEDSVASLLNRARWGDTSAYLKLADCYRDGVGVKRDFFSMLTMVNMAKSRGANIRVDDYIHGLPDGDAYKQLFLLMDRYKWSTEENNDSVVQALRATGSMEANALLGIIAFDQGDSISATNLFNASAEQGCTLAELMLAVPDKPGPSTIDTIRLCAIAERVPIAYSMLGDIYWKPDENGNTNMPLAVKFYMEAEKHGVLEEQGANRVLSYYRKGGNILLTDDDVKRLQLIAEPEGRSEE